MLELILGPILMGIIATMGGIKVVEMMEQHDKHRFLEENGVTPEEWQEAVFYDDYCKTVAHCPTDFSRSELVQDILWDTDDQNGN